MITIGYLADTVECIPTLITWFRGQWPSYFGTWSDEEMTADFLEDAARDRLPIRLVAFNDGELAGTIVLRQSGSGTMAGYEPELGGLYVPESQRGHGIGTELVKAGMAAARALGFEVVFATTVNAAGILERLGWVSIKMVEYENGEHALYECKL